MGGLRPDSFSAFHKKYGIKINSYNPDGNSQQEVDAVKANAGKPTQPDVVDLAPTIMAANTSLFTPYKVVEWSLIPKNEKAKNAVWYDDYTGYESIGYTTNIVKSPPKSMKDLLSSRFKGMVALNGNPLDGLRGLQRRRHGGARQRAARPTTSIPA